MHATRATIAVQLAAHDGWWLVRFRSGQQAGSDAKFCGYPERLVALEVLYLRAAEKLRVALKLIEVMTWSRLHRRCPNLCRARLN
jgi:hypothetical protein